MVAGPAGWLRESGSRLPHSKAFGWLVRRGYSAPLQGWVIYVIGYLGRCPRLVWSCAVGAQEGGLGEGRGGSEACGEMLVGWREYGASRSRGLVGGACSEGGPRALRAP